MHVHMYMFLYLKKLLGNTPPPLLLCPWLECEATLHILSTHHPSLKLLPISIAPTHLRKLSHSPSHSQRPTAARMRSSSREFCHPDLSLGFKNPRPHFSGWARFLVGSEIMNPVSSRRRDVFIWISRPEALSFFIHTHSNDLAGFSSAGFLQNVFANKGLFIFLPCRDTARHINSLMSEI